MESTVEQKLQIVKKWLGTGSINIFGMLLSGKDTQGQMLADNLGAALISGGEILRSSKIPDRAKRALDAGDLIDTRDYHAIVTPYLAKPEFTDKPLVLSAVGRWIGEEQTIIKAASDANHPIKSVIYININDQTAFDRLNDAQRDRPDDNAETLKWRIQEFKNKTLPVIDVYRQKGWVAEINGDQTRQAVFNCIVDALYKQATN